MNDLAPEMFKLTREQVDRAIGILWPHAQHYAELLRVVRSGGLAVSWLGRDAAWPRRQIEETRRPLLVVLGDDDGMSTGPAGFRCLNAACRWPKAAVVHAAGAELGQYAAFGAMTVLSGQSLLIETGSAYAEAWVAALVRHRVPTHVILPRGGVHPLPRRPETLQ